MKKLHVGYLIAAVEIGGAEKVVGLSAKYLTASKDFHVTLIPFVKERGLKNDFVLESKKNDLDIATIEMVHYKFRYWNVLLNLLHLCKIIRDKKINMLHTHGYRSNIIGALAAKITGIPSISTCHGWIDNTRALRLYNQLDKIFLRLSDKIIVVSHQIQSELIKRGLRAKSIEVLPNAIEAKKYENISRQRSVKRDKLGFDDKVPIIGSVGRLSSEKGYNYLLQACSVVVKKMPTLKIIIVGDGPERTFLKKLAQNMGLGKAVFFTGFLERIEDWLSIMDIFVISSKTEGSPLVLLEAMAAGLPVIATKVGEIPNILTHHQNGILIDYGNVKDLSDSILYLLNNLIKAKEMAVAGRKLVEQEYNVVKWIQQIESIYLNLLNKKHRSQASMNS